MFFPPIYSLTHVKFKTIDISYKYFTKFDLTFAHKTALSDIAHEKKSFFFLGRMKRVCSDNRHSSGIRDISVTKLNKVYPNTTVAIHMSSFFSLPLFIVHFHPSFRCFLASNNSNPAVAQVGNAHDIYRQSILQSKGNGTNCYRTQTALSAVHLPLCVLGSTIPISTLFSR